MKEVVELVPQERVQQRIDEQLVETPIEALQFQVRAMANETKGKYSGKEEFC